MNHIALQIERTGAGAIAESGKVVFDNTPLLVGNIRYNPITGVMTLSEPGRYLFHWWVAAQPSLSAKEIELALSTSQGDFLEGECPAKNGEVIGKGVIEVPETPVTVSLVNASEDTLFYSSVEPLKASMIVIADADHNHGGW